MDRPWLEPSSIPPRHAFCHCSKSLASSESCYHVCFFPYGTRLLERLPRLLISCMAIRACADGGRCSTLLSTTARTSNAPADAHWTSYDAGRMSGMLVPCWLLSCSLCQTLRNYREISGLHLLPELRHATTRRQCCAMLILRLGNDFGIEIHIRKNCIFKGWNSACLSGLISTWRPGPADNG